MEYSCSLRKQYYMGYSDMLSRKLSCNCLHHTDIVINIQCRKNVKKIYVNHTSSRFTSETTASFELRRIISPLKKLIKYTQDDSGTEVGNICSLWAATKWLTYAFLVISEGAFHWNATLEPFWQGILNITRRVLKTAPWVVQICILAVVWGTIREMGTFVGFPHSITSAMTFLESLYWCKMDRACKTIWKLCILLIGPKVRRTFPLWSR